MEASLLMQCIITEKQIKLTHYDKTKKWAYDSHIVRAKENLKLSLGGPSQGQASGTNQQTGLLLTWLRLLVNWA